MRLALLLYFAASPCRAEPKLAAAPEAPLRPVLEAPLPSAAAPLAPLPSLLPAAEAARPAETAARPPEGHAQAAAEAGRPFDLTAPNLGGLSAAAVFTPAQTLPLARRDFAVTSDRLSWTQTAAPAPPPVSPVFYDRPNFPQFSGQDVKTALHRHGKALDMALSGRGAAAAFTDGISLFFLNAASGAVEMRVDRAKPGETLTRLALAPDGAAALYAVNGSAGVVLEYLRRDANRAKAIKLDRPLSAIALSYGQAAVVSRDAVLTLWDLGSGMAARHQVPGTTQQNLPIAYDPSGERVAVANDEGQIFLYTTGSAARRTRLEGAAGQPLTNLVWSSGGSYLIASDARGVIRVWDLEARRVIALQAESGPIQAVAWDEREQTLLWAAPAGLRRASLREDKAFVSRTETRRVSALLARLDSRGEAAFWAEPTGTDVRLSLQALRESAADRSRREATEAAAREAAQREALRLGLLASRRAELMGRVEIAEDARLIRRLELYAGDSLEIFRIAGRKWLVELASLGDQEAASALARVLAADRAAAAKAVKK